MKKPVALVLGPSLEAISGVTTHVNSLLASRLSATYSLVHFQVGSEGRRESALGKLLRFALSPLALAARIARHNAAIVHVNCSLNAKSWWRDLAYVAMAKLCGARVVFQKHGGDLQRFVGNGVFRRFARWVLALPDVIVVLSQAEMDAYRGFVPRQNIALVPNGIDPSPYLVYNRRPADPAAPLKLLYIGRLAPGKGLSEALEALALARAAGTTAVLTIAGSGPEEARLRAQARALELGAQVTFAGPAWGEYKTKLLNNADVLLLASYSEGLPYSLLEGMAAGVVPVVTPVGAIPDVVTDGLHGHLVPVRNAKAIAEKLVLLDKERAALARMSQACRARVLSGYSLERLGDDFTAIYATLLSWPASQAG
jgi:glycosyltransferase involved in cell wall biosynthesis